MKNNVLRTKRAMRTALLVLLLSVVGIGKMYAQDFTVGDLNYSVNYDGTSVTVTGHVDGTSATGSLVIPESVTYNGNEYHVTEIGYDAFHFCSGMTGSLSIPNTVTKIGEAAFSKSGFTGNLSIPNSVTSIGDFAFAWCYGFSGDLIIPNSVIELGIMAFVGCTGFNGFLNISNSVTTIGSAAFSGCSGLKGSLIIPNSVTTIGYGAFRDCGGLTGSLCIPNSVTLIGHNAFVGCSGLSGCLTIPYSVDSIGPSAFAACSGLDYIEVMPGNPTYDSRNNCNAIIKSNSNELITGCKNTIIPNSVIKISDYAFSGCSSMVGTLSIPGSVIVIGNSAFYGCSGINSIIAFGLTPPILGDNVFYDVSCTDLVVPCDCVSAYETSAWHEQFTTIEEDCEPHNINIDESGLSGGSVNTSVNSTNMGEEVQFTITPNDGMELVSVTVFNANNPEQMVSVYPIGKANLTFGFIMPPFDVVIKAEFHPITTVDENDATWVSIYPNPSNGQIRIEAEGIKHISISNMLGQTIYKGNAENDVLQYDFGKHEAGMYLIRIEAANGVAVKKVSVTR